MSGRHFFVLVLLVAWLSSAAEGLAQTQTFFVTTQSDEATQLCATRFTTRLVNYKNFRATQDASTQRAVSECLGTIAGSSAQRSCAVSMANIEVDFLIRIKAVALGSDWSWTIEALSPSQGGDQVWGGSDLPVNKSDKGFSAYEACDYLAAQFACSQETLEGCADKARLLRSRGTPAATPQAELSTPNTQSTTPAVAPVVTVPVVQVPEVAEQLDPSISGWLVISGVTPDRATISVDGEVIGTGKGEYPVVAGQRRVVVTADGYEDFQTTVRVSVGAIETLDSIRLKKIPSYLTLRGVEPASAIVFVDGLRAGLASEKIAIPVGDHTVTIWEKGYESVQRKIRGIQGGTSIIEGVALRRLPTRWSIAISPVNGTLLIDGQPAGSSVSSFRPSRLGVQVDPVTEAIRSSAGLDMVRGARLSEVIDDGPAERAGLKVGDIVLRVDDVMVADSDQFLWMIQSSDTSTRRQFAVWRGGREVVIGVTLEPLVDTFAGYRGEILPGKHAVEVRAKGHRSKTIEFEIAAGESNGLGAYGLEEIPATIEVTANTDDAELFLNGELQRTLIAGQPSKLEVPAGEHSVVVGLASHEPFRKRLTIGAGETASLNAELRDLEPLHIGVTRSLSSASLLLGSDVPASEIASRLDCDEGCSVGFDEEALVDGIWRIELGWDQVTTSDGPVYERDGGASGLFFLDLHPTVPVTLSKSAEVTNPFTGETNTYTDEETLDFSRMAIGFAAQTPRNGFDLDFGFGEALEMCDFGADTFYGVNLFGFTEIYWPLFDSLAARLTYQLDAALIYISDSDSLFLGSQRVSLGVDTIF